MRPEAEPFCIGTCFIIKKYQYIQNTMKNNNVTREQFVNSVTEVVQGYIDNFYEYDENPTLRVNPDLLLVEVENGYGLLDDIDYSNMVIEEAANVGGDRSESDDDNHAKQDYDYYPARKFITVDSKGKGTVNKAAVASLADKYFG